MIIGYFKAHMGLVGVGIGIAVSVASFVVSAVSNRRVKKVCDRLDASIDSLVAGGVAGIDIPQTVVDEATRRQVARRVDDMLPGAISDGRKDAARIVTNQVTAAVCAEQSRAKEAVRVALDKELAGVNMTAVVTSVIESAKIMTSNKLEAALNDTINDFKRKLANTAADLRTEGQATIKDTVKDLKEEAKDEIDARIDEIVDGFEDRMQDVIRIYSAMAARAAGKE